MAASVEFVLFGSRARGDHRPDSDWDVVVMSPEFSDATNPGDILRYEDAARRKLGIPADAEIDLFFAHPDWALATHCGAYFDEHHGCWVGWGDYRNNKRR